MRKLIILLLLVGAVTAEPVPQLQQPGQYESHLVISPDARYLAVDQSKTISLWDLRSRTLLHKMKGFERVSDVKFTPDGKSVIVADYPRWIGYFDLDQGFRKRWELKIPWSGKGNLQGAGSYGVRISPDGKTLLAADSSHGAQAGDDVVRLISSSDGRVLNSHPKWAGRPYHSYFAFVDNDNFVRARRNKLQLYNAKSGEKLKEIRLGGNFWGFTRVDEEGILCRHYLEGGTKLVERLYSKDKLSLLEESATSQDAAPKHPDGELAWKADEHVLIVTKGAEVLFEGTGKDRVSRWIPEAGFVIARGEGRARMSTLYSASGKKLGPIDTFYRFFPGSPVGISITGYGSPCSIFDASRGKVLSELSFAFDAEVSEDASRMVVLMKNGVLIVDLPATLEQGRLVLVP